MYSRKAIRNPKIALTSPEPPRPLDVMRSVLKSAFTRASESARRPVMPAPSRRWVSSAERRAPSIWLMAPSDEAFLPA